MSDTAEPLAVLPQAFAALQTHAATLGQTSSALAALATALEAAHTALAEERASLLKKVEEAEAATAAAVAAAEEAKAEAEAAKEAARKAAKGGVNVNVSVGVGTGVKTRHPGCDACQGEGKEKSEAEGDAGDAGTMVKGSSARSALPGNDGGDDWGNGWGCANARGGSGDANASVSVRWGGLC